MAKDLTNQYKIDEEKGIVKYTVKCHGRYFTGKAKVNKEAGDVFNLDLGKRIAKLRALSKMKSAQLYEALEAQSFLRQLIEKEQIFSERIQKLTESSIRISDELERITE